MLAPARLLSACVALCFAVGSLAQADEGEKVGVQFVRIPANNEEDTALLLLDDKQTLEIELPTSALSPVYTVTKPKKWVIGKTGKNAEGESEFEALASAPAVAGKHQIVIVVDKGPDHDHKLELIAIDQAVEAETFLMVNASKHEISGKVDIDRFAIGPMEYATLNPKASTIRQGREFCDINFDFQKGERSVPFINASWRLEESAFGLIIFHHEPIAGKLKMQVIKEFVE